MTRRIPRDLAEECFRVVAKDSIRQPVSVEFDVFAWKSGIRLPAFHPETEPVPSPTGPRLMLEVLHPTRLRSGSSSDDAGTMSVSPAFVPAQFHPSELDPGRNLAYWSVVTFPRDSGIKKEKGYWVRGPVTATGRWRIWKADVLLQAVDLYWRHATEMGSDRLREHVREAMSWLEVVNRKGA